MPDLQDPRTAHWPPSLERVRIGDCVVDIPLREIVAPGARRSRRVTPKAMGVLLALASQADKVVSRDALLASVWPDTMPSDDVVTQAITQLRKALGEERGNPRYIETIAKNGYRLIAEVELLQDPAATRAASSETTIASNPRDTLAASLRAGSKVGAHAPDSEAPAAAFEVARTRTRRRLAVSGVVAALAIAVVAGVVFALRSTAPPPVGVAAETRAVAGTEDDAAGLRQPYRLITSAPGYELSPSLSPDAALVAYAATVPGRRGTVIMVQATEPAQPRQLSFPPDAVSDRSPAWSPDGREIAFARMASGDACEIRLAAANGGNERVVASCNPQDLVSFSWTPDGQGLIFGSRSTPQGLVGLQVLDLASGTWRRLDYRSSGSELDHAPRYSPDGRWIAFVRNPQMGSLWRLPAAGGEAELVAELEGEIRGWDWLPGGDAVVFGRRIDNQTRMYRLDIATREMHDLGIEDAQSPVVSSPGNSLAFVRRRPQFGIFRFEPTGDVDVDGDIGAGGQVQGERLFASSGRDTQPAVAPDGRQLVFTSDRSRRFSLWWADLKLPENLRVIEGVVPMAGSLPEWAADSRRLLILGRTPGNEGSPDAPGIHEIYARGGQVVRLQTPLQFPTQALYHPDPGHLLIVGSGASAQSGLHLYDRRSSPWREVESVADVSLARLDPHNNRILFTRFSRDGLWEVDLALSADSIRQVDGSDPLRWRFRSWAVDGAGRVYYFAPQPRCSSSIRLIATGPGPAPEPRCLASEQLAATTGFSIGAQDGSIFAALTADDGTDIGFMALPGTPAVSGDEASAN